MSNFEDSQGLGNIFMISGSVFPQENATVNYHFERPLTFRRQLELFKNIINILVNFWNNSGIYNPLRTQWKEIYHHSLMR